MTYTPKAKYQGTRAASDATAVPSKPGPKLTSRASTSLGSKIVGGLKQYGKDLASQARGEGRAKYGISAENPKKSRRSK